MITLQQQYIKKTIINNIGKYIIAPRKSGKTLAIINIIKQNPNYLICVNSEIECLNILEYNISLLRKISIINTFDIQKNKDKYIIFDEFQSYNLEQQIMILKSFNKSYWTILTSNRNKIYKIWKNLNDVLDIKNYNIDIIDITNNVDNLKILNAI